MFSIISRFPKYSLIRSTSDLIKAMSTEVVLKKQRYDGRTKKRRWQERRSDYNAEDPAKKQCGEPVVRVRRRKYAMLLSYSGANYYGMQRNPYTKTIEEDLFNALLQADLITKEAFEQVQSVQYQRAARTDKGVSAARQVVSIKLPEEVSIEKINELLPEVIRVFGIKRVTKGFNSKSQCDARTYTFMLPTIAFANSGEETTQETYRLSEETRSKVNDVLKAFLGTKNFHNFTSKKKHNDPSASRYMMSFECEPPIVRKGVEFAILKIKGQSFMLHQIRKMVGITLAIIRQYTTMDTLNKAFTSEKVNVSTAPSVGLLLDEVHYQRYNYRYGTDGMHETLDWKECDEAVTAFKEKYIYPTIIDTEINEKSMLTWLEDKLARHSYDVEDADGKEKENEEVSSDEDDDKSVTVEEMNINEAQEVEVEKKAEDSKKASDSS